MLNILLKLVFEYHSIVYEFLHTTPHHTTPHHTTLYDVNTGKERMHMPRVDTSRTLHVDDYINISVEY
jgi:hypothetical protein